MSATFFPIERNDGVTKNSEELIRIDIDPDGDIFGKRQFVERFADEPTQTHNCAAPQQNMESILSLQFFERGWRCVSNCELVPKIFLQTADQSFGRQFGASFVL